MTRAYGQGRAGGAHPFSCHSQLCFVVSHLKFEEVGAAEKSSAQYI
jgi:hypothetical protein